MKPIPEIISYLEANWQAPKQPRASGFQLKCSFEKPGEDVTESGVPSDIRQFWKIVIDATLFEDVDYGQWGLHLFNYHGALAATQVEKEKQWRSEHYRDNDLVIGEFLGDSDLLVLSRENKSTVYRIALPLDPRDEWPIVATSFTEFLNKYVSAEGTKFWEHT